MEFASDNVQGADPAVLAAMQAANDGTAYSYGADPWTARAESALSALFEREVTSFLVLTGSAANSLALSALVPAHGAVLCHKEAHINTDECGMPELFTGGAKLIGMAGAGAKLAPETLSRRLDQFVRGEHEVKPCAFSLTQATELGTVYSVAEVKALSDVAHARGLKVHMDGARFANAVASRGCSPAQVTWKAGVDVLSFGGTKNGAVMLEAVVFFDQALAQDFKFKRKRAGQLLSKGRFLGAQMEAYLKDGLWLANAGQANAMARRLAEGLAQVPGVRLPLPTQANEVFPIVPVKLHEALLAAGAHYYDWPGDGPGTDEVGPGEIFVRFVTGFRTTEADVDQLIAAAKRLG
ncbi:MAG: low specificity L-threonine aldolase [Aestuariivirgaceae bacterium]|nr:low specificity L-threonine aldolase [Aestuariivirgaceae bacterium]